MEFEILWMCVGILLGMLCAFLLIRLYLYRRQIESICRQLDVHEREDSNTEIWLDKCSGPFRMLQQSLNRLLDKHKSDREEVLRHEEAWKGLVANVSHDFRTPITSVSGYFQLLLETEDEEKRAEYVKIIRSRLDSFSLLLDDFYIYATVKSKDRVRDREDCNLSRILGESLLAFHKEIEAKLGTPSIILPEEDVHYWGSRLDLERIFQNIIRNAINYGAGDFSVELRKDRKGIEISFRNRCAEQLPAKVDQVFERTYRADAARSSMNSGLGLCIVKELVEGMGGSVKAFAGEKNYFEIRVEL